MNELQQMLASLIDDATVDARLFDICCKLAKRVLSQRPSTPRTPCKDEICDVAGDFLLYLRKRRKKHIETEAGLSVEMAKFLTIRNDPEGHELWELFSDALRTACKAGQVRRLDAGCGARNHNRAVWTSVGKERDDVKLDVAEFEGRSKEIGCFYPSRSEGRIVTPARASELALALLKAADGPIPFHLLVDEARRHVVLTNQEPCPLADEEREDAGPGLDRDIVDRHNDMLFWVDEEARSRSSRIWQRAGKTRRVLCLYVLPKEFCGRKVKMQSLGKVQTVSGHYQRLMEILSEELHLESLSAERIDGNSWDHDTTVRELVAQVVANLQRLCAENQLNGCFSSNGVQ